MEAERSHSFKGTLKFMAPEVVKGAFYSEQSDIWALGIMILHMLSGAPPFSNVRDKIQILNMIRNLKNPPDFPNNTSKNLRDFLNGCLAVDPKKRKICKDLLKMDFITKEAQHTLSPNQSITSRNNNDLMTMYSTFYEEFLGTTQRSTNNQT